MYDTNSGYVAENVSPSIFSAKYSMISERASVFCEESIDIDIGIFRIELVIGIVTKKTIMDVTNKKRARLIVFLSPRISPHNTPLRIITKNTKLNTNVIVSVILSP